MFVKRVAGKSFSFLACVSSGMIQIYSEERILHLSLIWTFPKKRRIFSSIKKPTMNPFVQFPVSPYFQGLVLIGLYYPRQGPIDYKHFMQCSCNRYTKDQV